MPLSEANKRRTFSMRCPKCGKHIRGIRKEYATRRSIVRCKHCMSKVKIKKVLSPSEKRPRGLKIEIVEDLLGSVFNFIKEHQGTYLSEICSELKLSKHKVGLRISILVEQGLIQIVPERQIKRLELTQKGHWHKGAVIV